MRILILMMCLLTAAGCTRPSAGFSFHDLVWAASDGLREYERWVEKDTDGFPNVICLAGIEFTASLAESKSRSGGVGLPLAAPTHGLSGMLGYKFISTESQTGAITASLVAKYQQEPQLTVEQSKEAIAVFMATKAPKLYEDWEVADMEVGEVRTPTPLPEYERRERPPFAERDDLAAELWRIRQALHTAVLNSPPNFVMEPGEMTLRIGYKVTFTNGVQAQITMGPGVQSEFGASSGATENNEMVLVYVYNQSPDQMTCNRDSAGRTAFGDAIKDRAKFAQAVAAPAPPK